MSKKKVLAICIGAVVLIAVGVILYFVLSGGGPYKGTVTATADGAPMANVSVSDGRNVVKTDENGQFTLKGWRKARFITVTAPAGYTTESYYIPVSHDTERYDFTLDVSPIPAGAAHSFLQISDTEIGEKGVGEWIGAVQKTAEEQNAAFLIHTGDICYEAGLKRHILDMNTENMGLPVRYVIGNHDYVDGKYGEALFESLYGPVWYSFEVGNVHYVVTPFQNGADKRSGYNKNDRWRWLENDLANTDPDMKVVMFNHTTPYSDDYVIEFDRKSLDLKEHNLIAWVYGHYHYNYIEENNGVLNISTARPDCGGIDQSASGSRLISIDENGQIKTKMFYYDFDAASAASAENARWTSKLSGNVLFCDTLYSDGKIYTATVDDDYPRSCGIYCLNAADGSILWTYKTENSVKNKLILENGLIVAQDCAGNVYCLDAANGSLVWQTEVSLGNGLNTSSGLCVSGGVVYAGCAAGVTALQLDTGSKLWDNIRNKGECSAAEFVVTGNKLIVSSHWDALVALDKNTGEQLWEIKDEDIRFRSSTPAVIDENTLLVADDDAIMLVNSSTGEITSKTVLENYKFNSSAQPVIANGKAYIATANKGVLAFDLTTQEILWETAVGRATVYTAPYTNGDSKSVEPTMVLQGESLVFGASDGNLYRIAVSDGHIEKQISIGAPIFGTVAMDADGSLYLADFAGRVHCIEAF